MVESSEGPDEGPKPQSGEVVEKIRTKEPQAPFGADEPNPDVVSDATVDEMGPGEATEPGAGGYGGRDPQTDMPKVPGAPETQEDPKSHDAAPSDDKERGRNE
jgi:hypothetical protein